MCAFSRATDLLCIKGFPAHESVDERGLPNTGRAKQAMRLAWIKSIAELIQSEARHVAEREDISRDAGVFDLINPPRQFFLRNQVCLAQDDLWLNVAIVSHHQVSVESGYVEILPTPLHNEGNVDIRCNHLEVHGLARALATQECLSWQDLMDDGRAA